MSQEYICFTAYDIETVYSVEGTTSFKVVPARVFVRKADVLFVEERRVDTEEYVNGERVKIAVRSKVTLRNDKAFLVGETFDFLAALLTE